MQLRIRQTAEHFECFLGVALGIERKRVGGNIRHVRRLLFVKLARDLLAAVPIQIQK